MSKEMKKNVDLLISLIHLSKHKKEIGSIIKQLVDSNPQIIDMYSSNQEYPLCEVAKLNNFWLFNILYIDNKVKHKFTFDPLSRDFTQHMNDNSPLWYAINNYSNERHIDLIKWLIDHNAYMGNARKPVEENYNFIKTRNPTSVLKILKLFLLN